MAGKILILCATRLEMAAFLDRHRTGFAEKSGKGLVMFSSLDHLWDLVISGPGVFNAARALTACLERFTPACILHTGIAGMFDSSGLQLGDAAVALTDTYIHAGVDTCPAGTDHTAGTGTAAMQNHRNDTASGKPGNHPERTGSLSGPEALPDARCPHMPLNPLPFDLVAGQKMTRQGVYVLDPDLAGSCTDLLGRSLGCRVIQGPFVTVSAITGSFEKAAVLSQTFSPVMESMEGAAAAHVAALYQVPMVEIRAGSNRVGERDKNRWDLMKAARTVADICDTFLTEST